MNLGDMSARVGSVSAKGQRTMVRRAVRTMRSMSDTCGAVSKGLGIEGRERGRGKGAVGVEGDAPW